MGWIIFGGIILLIAVILMLSVSFELNVEEQADFRIRYAIFSIFPLKKKNKNKKAAQKKNKGKGIQLGSGEQKPSKKAAKKLSTEKPVTKSTKTKQKIDFIMIKSIIESIKDPFQKLVRKIRINELNIKSVVAGDDAAKTAINYGLQCAAISTSLAWLDANMKLTVKNIDIRADFNGKDSDFFLHCKIKIRVITLVICLIAFLRKYLKEKEG